MSTTEVKKEQCRVGFSNISPLQHQIDETVRVDHESLKSVIQSKGTRVSPSNSGAVIASKLEIAVHEIHTSPIDVQPDLKAV